PDARALRRSLTLAARSERVPARPSPAPTIPRRMRHPSAHLFDLTPDRLKAWCAERGMPAFRAAQILEWVYRQNTADPAAMTNLSARDRETLAREMTFLSGRTVAHQGASDGTQ